MNIKGEDEEQAGNSKPRAESYQDKLNPCQVILLPELGIQGRVKKHPAVKVNQPINKVCKLQMAADTPPASKSPNNTSYSTLTGNTH